MRITAFLIAVILFGPAHAWSQQADETNINTRYTIASVELPAAFEARLSASLRDDLAKLKGEKFDPETVARLRSRIGRELRGYQVTQRVEKGDEPETLRVVFEISRQWGDADNARPRLVYHSRQNFTFGLDLDVIERGHKFSFGILTDNDERIERYSGLRGGYERSLLGNRLRAGFMAETWRSQWKSSVEAALDARAEGAGEEIPGIYRKRQSFQPALYVEPVPGLTLGAGVSLQRLQTQFPSARYETAHALTSSLQVERDWAKGGGDHALEAGYSVRAATEALGSDFRYTRHAFEAGYSFRGRNESVKTGFRAGYLSGRAPLFERFVLGNSTTLRGYNKYDIAPLGGSRMAHGSFDYRYRIFRIVYDAGTVHERGGESAIRHSITGGLTFGRGWESFSFLVAFPLTEGSATPVLLMGISF